MTGSTLNFSDIDSQLKALPKISLELLAETTSTNDWLMQQCRNGAGLPYACFAEAQTSGRGRRGKHWYAGVGANIMMSVACVLPNQSSMLSKLPLVIAMAMVDVLEAAGLEDVSVKWPNDIFVSGRKMAGVLIETMSLPKGQQSKAVIIGVGVNYDLSSVHSSELAALPVTDFVSESRVKEAEVDMMPSRSVLAGRLLAACLHAYSDFPDNVENCFAEYRKKYDFCQGKMLDILLDNGEALSGVGVGISSDAALRVKVDGIEKIFHSADVSVRVLT